MSDESPPMMLSSHEILRFSAEQARMHVRHVGLYRETVCIALRDEFPAGNLWELLQIEGTLRLTRFSKRRSLSFDGPFSHGFNATITPEFFERVLTTHRLAIVQKIRAQIERSIDDQASANGFDEHGARAADERLRELHEVAGRLFPRDFPV